MHPFTARMVKIAKSLKEARQANPSLNRSIHPRVVNGRTRFEKVNTHKPSRA